MTRTHEVRRVATTVSTDDDGYTRVVYHQTTVVKWNWQEIILNSGGWRTATTKARMNQASNQFGLGFIVYQEKFKWYVVLQEPRDTEYRVIGAIYDWDNPIDFHDGMKLSRKQRY